MGNVLNIFSQKPKAVVEDALEVFEIDPSSKVIDIDVVDEPVQYDLS